MSTTRATEPDVGAARAGEHAHGPAVGPEPAGAEPAAAALAARAVLAGGAPAAPPPPGGPRTPPVPALLLQRQVGNAAVARLVQPRSVQREAVQREVGSPEAGPSEAVTSEAVTSETVPSEPVQRWVDPEMKEVAREANTLPSDYAAKNDTDKIAAIQAMMGVKTPSVIGRAWAGLSDELGMAKAHPDLFERSVKANDDILDHSAFEPIRETFKKDVEQTALNYLAANRRLVQDQMTKTGVDAEGQGKEATAEQDFAVRDAQKAAADMERIKKAKTALRSTKLGYTHSIVGPTDTEVEDDEFFNPSGPPSLLIRSPGAPSWEEVNQRWLLTMAMEAALIREHPEAAFFLGQEGDPKKLKDAADVKAARGEISKALHDLAARIDKAVPLIGDDLTFVDFPPIHSQLLGGGQKGPSGTNWGGKIEKAVAKEEIGDANLMHTLKMLGVGTVTAALFIFAELATGGLATFLFAAGAVASAGTAAMSWDKAFDLSTAQQATVDPDLAIVTQEQVDSAVIGAMLDTVFAFIDAAQAFKGGYTALKGGKAILEASKAGAEVGAKAALKNLAKEANPGKVVTEALFELGPEGVQKASGKSFQELADIVGKESDAGKRFLEWAEKGRDAITLATEELLNKLPNIAKLPADEAEKVLKAGIETYGMAGTLKQAGGWKTLMGSGVGGTATGKQMEAWRQSIVDGLNKFIEQESDAMAKGVRTGTPKASSDVDVQVIGGAAAELQEKAEGWLAGRLGTNVDGAKKLLDAEIFVDPTRAHLIDIMKDISPEIRGQIAARSSTYEKQMIFGARLKEAEKSGKEAVQKVLDEAKDLGIEPFKEFEKLSAGEQKRVAQQIDGWMTELKGATDEAKKAELVERISKAQAMINASHGDAYTGGAVRVWVTGRGEDAEAIAKALGMTAEELKAVTNAQRVVSSLSEGKWMDAALKQLKVGKEPEQIAKAIKDLGKHGSRAAEVLRVPGKTSVETLGALADDLMKYKAMYESGELVRKVASNEMGALQANLSKQLASLKGETAAAIKALEAEAKVAKVPVEEMAKFQDWVKWQATLAALSDLAANSTAAYLRMLETAIATGAKQTPEGPPPPPNYQPGTGPAVHVPGSEASTPQ